MGSVPVFRVVTPGPLAMLQDAGRFGVRHLGITQGGAADLHAWAWANWLLGNAWGAAGLEVTFGGLVLEAVRGASVALTGADLGVTLDDVAVTPWQTLRLEPGQRLAFGSPRSGLRAYLAVAGGFCAENVLGSLSAVGRERLGGHDGEGGALAVGDVLHGKPEDDLAVDPTVRDVPESERCDYSELAELDMIPGAQIAHFSGRSIFDVFNQVWEVDNRSDRMGIRLKGPLISGAVNNMISEGLALGAVQVPPDGHPIVLLNDRQTIGGYPRLGTVTPLACSRLAQCNPGTRVRFRPKSLEKAHRQYAEFLRFFRGRVK